MRRSGSEPKSPVLRLGFGPHRHSGGSDLPVTHARRSRGRERLPESAKGQDFEARSGTGLVSRCDCLP